MTSADSAGRKKNKKVKTKTGQDESAVVNPGSASLCGLRAHRGETAAESKGAAGHRHVTGGKGGKRGSKSIPLLGDTQWRREALVET